MVIQNVLTTLQLHAHVNDNTPTTLSIKLKNRELKSVSAPLNVRADLRWSDDI